ncbi:MAG: RseA family anti-sigma factor [Chromatiaceae bacterium]|nr:hypothetical protein [Chromatiaceae bacterium]
MSEQQREHVSALADGELETLLVGPTISALEANADLKAAWERYSLIGSALRGEALRPEYRQIAARVSEELAAGPIPLSASRPAHRQPRPRAAETSRSRRGHYAGVALAASAAFLAVYALPPLFTASNPVPTSPALAQVTPPISSPVAVSVSPPPSSRLVSLSPSRTSEVSPRWHLAAPELESKLDQFLVNHQASSPANGIKGIFPYATVVGYEAGR